MQAMKAGILEIADVYVVNKADREGADNVVRDLRNAMSQGDGPHAPGWRPPIIKTVAATNEGVVDLLRGLEDHQSWLDASGSLVTRRTARAAAEIESIVVAAVRERIGDLHAGTGLDRYAGDVVAGKTDPYAAADIVRKELTDA
jgi:GTPase